MNTPSSGKLFCNCLKIIRVFTISVQVRFGLGTTGFVKQFHNPCRNLSLPFTLEAKEYLIINTYIIYWLSALTCLTLQRCCTAVPQCSLLTQFELIWSILVKLNPFKHFHFWTYQRPSRWGHPGEPPVICTRTFTNPPYPKPRLFNKKLLTPLP